MNHSQTLTFPQDAVSLTGTFAFIFMYFKMQHPNKAHSARLCRPSQLSIPYFSIRLCWAGLSTLLQKFPRASFWGLPVPFFVLLAFSSVVIQKTDASPSMKTFSRQLEHLWALFPSASFAWRGLCPLVRFFLSSSKCGFVECFIESCPYRFYWLMAGPLWLFLFFELVK